MDAVSGEQLTVSTTALGFTAGTLRPTGSDPIYRAVVHVNVGVVRMRYDGTNPTATVGISLGAGSTYTVDGLPNVSQVRMISQDGANAEVFCTYERGLGL